MLESNHYKHCDKQCKRIEHAPCMEVRLTPISTFCRILALLPSIICIKCQQESDEETGHHNIAKAQHTEVFTCVFGGSRQFLRKHEFDRPLHTCCNFDHHLCTEYPKDIVNKQAREQQTPVLERPNRLIRQ